MRDKIQGERTMTIGDGIFGAAVVFALTPLFYMFVFAAWEWFVDIKERRPLTLADNLLDAGRPCNASAPRRWRGITPATIRKRPPTTPRPLLNRL